jgi:hypothetical protein
MSFIEDTKKDKLKQYERNKREQFLRNYLYH